MRILVAGATSVPGIPLLRELNARGHDVVGLTSQPTKTPQIEQEGAKPVVANVFDAAQINAVVADIEPEAVVSLLTTLPKWGPKRPKDFEPAKKLWSTGATNLVRAAQRAGVRRVVAESMVFAYGYPTTSPALMDESDPYPGPPPKGGDDMLAALRGMEQTVLTSGDHSDTEGIVLRYGIFYGPGVPHDELFTRLAKWWALPAMTGNGLVPWIHIDDIAKATADALDKGRGGQMTHRRRPTAVVRRLCSRAVRQTPSAAADADSLSAGGLGRVVSGNGVRNDSAAAVERQGQGRTRLDAYSPVKIRGPLLKRRGDAFGEIFRRQHRCVPCRHVTKAFRDPRDALLIQHVLDAVDGEWGVAGDLGSGCVRGRQRRVGVVVDVVDQADFLGARGVDVLACQRQFAQVAVGQDERKPGKATDVGDHSQLDLAHRELRVGTGVADVDGRDQVNAAADAPPVY